MIVEAQKVENGLFIPMIVKFKEINPGKILVEIGNKIPGSKILFDR